MSLYLFEQHCHLGFLGKGTGFIMCNESISMIVMLENEKTKEGFQI